MGCGCARAGGRGMVRKRNYFQGGLSLDGGGDQASSKKQELPCMVHATCNMQRNK